MQCALQNHVFFSFKTELVEDEDILRYLAWCIDKSSGDSCFYQCLELETATTACRKNIAAGDYEQNQELIHGSVKLSPENKVRSMNFAQR